MTNPLSCVLAVLHVYHLILTVSLSCMYVHIPEPDLSCVVLRQLLFLCTCIY